MTEVHETFEFGFYEQDVLSFDPANRRSKLVHEQLHEHCVSEHLAMFWGCPILFLPLLQYLIKMRGTCLIVNKLAIILGNIKWLGHQVGYKFSDEDIGIELGSVNLFGKVHENEEWSKHHSIRIHSQTLNGMMPAHK
jgi:hypothetical protein